MIVVATIVPTWSFFDDTKYFENKANEHEYRCTEEKYKKENDGRPVILGDLSMVIDSINARAPRLYLIVYSLGSLQYCLIDVIDFHIPHDTGTCYIITFHIGKFTFKSLARGDKVSPVFHRNHNDQTSTILLSTNTLVVTYILCHSERITLLHTSNDNKYRLYPTLFM